jgi:hypothetical protein
MLIENPVFCEILQRFGPQDTYLRPERQDFGWNSRSGALSVLDHTAQRAGLVTTT